MNEGPRVVHTKKISMSSVNQMISTSNIAKGLIEAGCAIGDRGRGQHVTIQEVSRTVKKGLLSIDIEVKVFLTMKMMIGIEVIDRW